MARTSQITKNTGQPSQPAEPRAEYKVGELMDNSGKKPLCVPGHGLPISYELDRDDRFQHGIDDSSATRLTVKEVQMLAFMNSVTDKDLWHVKLEDKEITARWKAEALATAGTLLTEICIDWCLEELHEKTSLFKQHLFVKVLDSDHVVVKSDVLGDSGLREDLVLACKPLLDIPEAQRDWHPNSDNKVLNLVHPSLHPLVYGRTRVLTSGQVGLTDCLDSVGKGRILDANQALTTEKSGRGGWHRVDKSIFWSKRFQWLPAEVSFDKNNSIKFQSYVNNLNPMEHSPLYVIIEQIISASIQPWNAVLFKGYGYGQQRIECNEAFYHPPEPKWATNKDQAGSAWLEQYGHLPDVNEVQTDDEEDEDDEEDGDSEEDEDNEEDEDSEGDEDSGEDDMQSGDVSKGLLWVKALRKYKRVRQVIHPEPQTISAWKARQRRLPPNQAVDLQTDFREAGLQIIVKLACIELSPEKPEYEGGSWHLEGQLNEHIAATSIFYYDCDNVTESRLRFRQSASLDETDLNYEQDDHAGLEAIFGCPLRDEPAVQEIGSVATPQGRLLVFPNTLQHRVEPFRLVDPTKPGHRRFLVLWLVDPHYRILSTRNVPPQQHSWWLDATLRKTSGFERLPQEVTQLVMDQTTDFPLSLDDAKELRLELMAERTTFGDAVQRNVDTYNLCEH